MLINSPYKNQFLQLLRSENEEQFHLAMMIAQGKPLLKGYLDHCIAVRTIKVFRREKPPIKQNVEISIWKEFNLKVKSLREKQIVRLLPGIKLLRSLSLFNLSINKLTEIPSEIGALQNLKVLRLSHNALTRLPQEICQLQQLEHLYLHGNPIDFTEREKIKSWLPKCNITF